MCRGQDFNSQMRAHYYSSNERSNSPIIYGTTKATIPTPTISRPDIIQCLSVNVVFQNPIIKREEYVKIADTIRLFSGACKIKNGIIGIIPPTKNAINIIKPILTGDSNLSSISPNSSFIIKSSQTSLSLVMRSTIMLSSSSVNGALF